MCVCVCVCQARFRVILYIYIIQPKDKVVPFLKKLLYIVAPKLSLEVVPFCKTQGNSRDLSLLRRYKRVFVCVCVFSCVQVGFRYLLMFRVNVVFVAFSWGEIELIAVAFLSVTFCMFRIPFSNYYYVKMLLNRWLLLSKTLLYNITYIYI